MAEKDRNRQGPFQLSQKDWRDRDRQRHYFEEEPNYTISENRGHRDSGRYSGSQEDDGGWDSRYERQMNTNREGDFNSGYHPGRYGRQPEGDYNRGLSSAYSDFGGNYGSREENRNLYDRGNEGITRRDFENRSNRLGAANYGAYGDRGRYEQDRYYGGNRGAQHGGNYDRADYRDRDYGRGESEDRSWWDRTTDEVSSWFGDEGAERRRETDRNHRGKGPKNYSRSDERIKEDINDRLSDDPFIDASDIDVTISSGEVTLTGTVDHRSSKRRAEDLAESVSGVKNVENRLRVGQYAGSSGMNSPSGQTTSAVPGSDRSGERESSYSSKNK